MQNNFIKNGHLFFYFIVFEISVSLYLLLVSSHFYAEIIFILDAVNSCNNKTLTANFAIFICIWNITITIDDRSCVTYIEGRKEKKCTFFFYLITGTFFFHPFASWMTEACCFVLLMFQILLIVIGDIVSYFKKIFEDTNTK